MSHHDELLRIIREVRSRWRWKVVLRSVTVLAGSAVLALVAVAYGLEQFRFSPASVIGFRVLTYVLLVALGWFYFVRPLGRRVSDQQVALYLEEHEPSLQEMLISAVDVGSPERSIEHTGESAALLHQIVRSAVERCQASISAGVSSARASARRWSRWPPSRPSPRSSSVSARRTCGRVPSRCSCRSRARKRQVRTAST